jgi:hypothetical protein
MIRQRYMIVEHPRENEMPHADKKFADYVLPIHTMLGTYHWARLDDVHVLVTGQYPVSHHAMIQSHPKTSVLPMVGSGKLLKEHLSSKAEHWKALSSGLSLDDTSTTSDLVEAAEAKFGVLFGSNK